MRTKRNDRGHFDRSSPRRELATTARPLPPPFTDNISNVTGSSASVISGDEDMDDFLEDTCLECDEGGEGLLVCCGIDCPVALHETCISGEPRCVGGKFYCPYCWYKHLVARVKELRKKALLAKKDFDSYFKLNPEMAYLDKEKQNNEREKGKEKIIRENNRCEPVNSMNVDDEVHNGAREVQEDHQHDSNEKLPCSDQSGEVDECVKTFAAHADEIQANEEAMEVEQGKNDGLDDDDDEKHEGANVDEECVAEETVLYDAFQGSPGTKSGTSNTSERDPVSMEKEEETEATRKPVEEFERVDTLNAQCVAGKTLVDGALHGSPGTKCDTSSASERDRISMEKKEQMDKGAPTANVPCTGVGGALNEPEVPDSETENFEVQQRHIKQRKSEKQPEIPSKKRIELPSGREKRRRITWKLAEEDALREGMQKFSTVVNKNVPWRKILEFGSHIFDPSRTPTDLKDKWRNMAKHTY